MSFCLLWVMIISGKELILVKPLIGLWQKLYVIPSPFYYLVTSTICPLWLPIVP